jgi:hypothetical protein
LICAATIIALVAAVISAVVILATKRMYLSFHFILSFYIIYVYEIESASPSTTTLTTETSKFFPLYRES